MKQLCFGYVMRVTKGCVHDNSFRSNTLILLYEVVGYSMSPSGTREAVVTTLKIWCICSVYSNQFPSGLVT